MNQPDNPKVSIITPSFNQVRYLEQTILSVLNQDYPNLEYLVIDGGSTDGSVDIIKKYQTRIAYWESEPDTGQSHAINKGIRKSTGDIIAWLNSDDLYFPSAVSHAVQEFKKNNKLALFYGNCVFIDKKGKFIRYFTEVEDWNELRLRNYTDFIMQPTTFFSREKLYQVGLLDENLRYGMDWDLWCRLAQSGDVIYRNLMIAANRDYDETKTNSGSWDRLRELLIINTRHMTGYWPHAFFGYCATELRQKADTAINPCKRFIYRFVRLIMLSMSPIALLHNRRSLHKRNLYGIRRHSGIIDDGVATIHLPINDKVRAFKIVVRTRQSGIVEMHYGGTTLELAVNGSPAEEILPLNKDAPHDAHLELQLSFRNQYGDSISGEIINVEFKD